MKRLLPTLAMAMLMPVSPANAMPNAFWIFGFDLPLRSKSDRVGTVELSQGLAEAERPSSVERPKVPTLAEATSACQRACPPADALPFVDAPVNGGN